MRLWFERETWPNPVFDSVHRLVAPYTQASVARSRAWWDAVDGACYAEAGHECMTPGDVVECGVYKGGQSILAAHAIDFRGSGKTLWLYDTFTGMTAPSAHDPARARNTFRTKKRWCKASATRVRRNFRSCNISDQFIQDQVRFIAGPVEETLRVPANLPEEICALRLDTDWYESTKVELEVLWPRLAIGGVLIVDDYGHWKGARKAVDEFMRDKRVELRKLDHTGVIAIKWSE